MSFSVSVLDQANNPSRLATFYDDSRASSYSYPCSTLLGGIAGWVRAYRLPVPLYGLMVSRYRRDRASPLHQRDRNFTCTEKQVIKDQIAVYVPNPWPRGHFWETDRSSPNGKWP